MEKETRSFPAKFSVRKTAGGPVKISGYAAVFNRLSEDLGGFREKIAPGAFSEALRQSDVRCLINHDPNQIVGRTGVNLTLKEDRNGLFMELLAPEKPSQRFDQMASDIENGLISQQSFGFRMPANQAGETWDKVDGEEIRTITRVEELLDCSPCTFPAYRDTSVAKRHLQNFTKNGSLGPRKARKMNLKQQLRDGLDALDKLSEQDGAAYWRAVGMVDEALEALESPVLIRRDGLRTVMAYIERDTGGYIVPDLSDDGQRSRFTYGDRDENDWTGTGEFFRDVAKAMSPGGGLSRKMQAHLTRASGLSEITPSDGGFLLPEQMAQGIFKAAFDTGLVASRVTRIPVSGNSLKIPTADETSRATGSRWGGIQSYWINEGGTVTATKPKFASLNLELEKLMSIAYVTQELLDDVPAMGAYLENAFRDEIAFMMDDAIINGTGAGMPLGVLNANCLVTVSKEDGQAADCIVYQNILAMWKRMPARNRKNSIWLVNQDAESELYQMTLDVGTGGSPVYLPAGGASVAPYSTLFSRPVVPIEQCAALGDLGDIILFDPTAYLLIEKNGGPVPAWSAHVRFLYDEMTFRLVYRVDGQPLWSSAITPFRGSNDLSMCVTLEAR
ncbi:MAG: phage major capsid protein [Clostridiales bacterium]|nr:phage major capsid protein [Clostridiales bacterium]